MRLFLNSLELKNLHKFKKNIEQEFNVKISIEKTFIDVSGEALDEYSATEIINAIAAGFDFKIARLLQDSEFMFTEIKIKDYTKKPKRIREIKARIIGTKGRALKTFIQLSDCAIELHDNKVVIIGKVDDVKIAESAIISLIKGSKHGNVYARLEHKPEHDDDLGLKEQKK